MSQLKFDIAEFLVNSQKEARFSLEDEIRNVLNTKNFYEYNGLLLSFEDAFADFVVYKLQWWVVDNTSFSYEQVAEVVDKSFLVDLFGDSVLSSEGWEN